MAVDKVRALKIETTTDGSSSDPFPREMNPAQDYAAVKGVSLENSDIELINLSSDSNITSPSLASVILSKNKIENDNKAIYTISLQHQLINFDEIYIDGILVLNGELTILG